MTLPLFDLSEPAPDVPAEDRRGTPLDLLRAVLALEERYRFDLDAAAEPGMHAPCRRYLTAEMDALSATPWRSRMDHPIDDLPPLVWCNPPFSDACGGKVRWIRELRRRARDERLRAWLLLPCASGQDWFREACEGADTWLLVAGRRIDYRSPAGLTMGSPGPLNPCLWRYVPDDYRDRLSGIKDMIWLS